jgi:hypothetical protein
VPDDIHESDNKMPGDESTPGILSQPGDSAQKDSESRSPAPQVSPRANQGDEDEDKDENDDKKAEREGPLPLKEELQIEDLSRCIYFKDSKLFAAAGPGLPLLQVNTDGTFVSLDPERPYTAEVHEEVVVAKADEHGRLLDPLGQIRKLVGMKYKGNQLYYVNKYHPDNGLELAAWFDDKWQAHYLYFGDTVLSASMVLKIRDRMVDGELSVFEELSSD